MSVPFAYHKRIPLLFCAEQIEVGIAATLLGGIAEETEARTHKDCEVEGLLSLATKGLPSLSIERILEASLVLAMLDGSAEIDRPFQTSP